MVRETVRADGVDTLGRPTDEALVGTELEVVPATDVSCCSAGVQAQLTQPSDMKVVATSVSGSQKHGLNVGQRVEGVGADAFVLLVVVLEDWVAGVLLTVVSVGITCAVEVELVKVVVVVVAVVPAVVVVVVNLVAVADVVTVVALLLLLLLFALVWETVELKTVGKLDVLGDVGPAGSHEQRSHPRLSINCTKVAPGLHLQVRNSQLAGEVVPGVAVGVKLDERGITRQKQVSQPSLSKRRTSSASGLHRQTAVSQDIAVVCEKTVVVLSAAAVVLALVLVEVVVGESFLGVDLSG